MYVKPTDMPDMQMHVMLHDQRTNATRFPLARSVLELHCESGLKWPVNVADSHGTAAS